MNSTARLVATSLATLIVGCSGNLLVYTNPADACVLNNGQCSNVYTGVFYRPVVTEKELYLRDRILGPKGELTHYFGGDGDKGCNPVAIQETVLVPSKHEYLISYDPAFFETSKFSVTLTKEGTLSAVSTESTPGGKALTESLVSLATTMKALNHGAASGKVGDTTKKANLPFCNSGKLPITEDMVFED